MAVSETPATFAEWAQLFRHVPMWVMIVGGFCLQYTFWFYISWLPTSSPARSACWWAGKCPTQGTRVGVGIMET